MFFLLLYGVARIKPQMFFILFETVTTKNISFYPLPPFIYLFICYLSVIFTLLGFLLLLSPPHITEGYGKHSVLWNMKDAVTSDSPTFKEWVYYSSFFVMWASGKLNNVLLYSTQNVYILIPRTCEFHCVAKWALLLWLSEGSWSGRLLWIIQVDLKISL